MWVVHLKNADARQAGHGGARGLRRRRRRRRAAAAAARRRARATPARRRRAPGGASAAVDGADRRVGRSPRTGGFIQADPATNSLIITAPEPLYRQVRAMIDQLDSRRAQVYIESLIVEVAGDNAADFGFQWQGLIGQNGDKYGVVGGTNFSSRVGQASSTSPLRPRRHHAAQRQTCRRGPEHRPARRLQRHRTRWPPSRACCRAQANTNIVSRRT